MSFIEDLITELNKVKLYDVDDNGKQVKTVECSVICDIINILLDKYGMGGINDDLHG